MTRSNTRLAVDETLLLVIDYQRMLVPHIANHEAVIAAGVRMIRAACVLNVPAIITEQYPKGLGPTVAPIREAFGDRTVETIEKLTFSCCTTEPITTAIARTDRSQILVIGIESHVCVQQTVLDLLTLGYVPFVCADAIGSRRELDRDMAIERMRQAGAVLTTTESATFELLRVAGTPEFKEIIKIVK